jgi:phage tail-like protein
MSFNLETVDPLVATNFFLTIGSNVVVNITSVDGLNLEIETADINQRTAKGILVQHKTMSKPKWTGELTVKRLAPLDATNDELWKWFMSIRTTGMSAAARAGQRKSGGISIYDTTMTLVASWTFTNAWPSKIETEGLDVTKNDPVSETITLQYETLERTK